MIPAVVSAAVALFGGLIAIFALALEVRSAEQRAADARVDAQTKAGELAVALANAATQKARADTEQRRADALDDLLAMHASDGPVDGAYERLVRKWLDTRKGTNTADSASDKPVSATSAPIATGPEPASGSGHPA